MLRLISRPRAFCMSIFLCFRWNTAVSKIFFLSSREKKTWCGVLVEAVRLKNGHGRYDAQLSTMQGTWQRITTINVLTYISIPYM